MQQNNSICGFNTSNSWIVLSPIEQGIKRKIETVGVPLKDWDIQINYGIKTGYNEAFIISGTKREEILTNCQTEDECKRTAELIRPILRGRDIKRYSYEWANLYLIATFPSCKYDIEQYPAVKRYLLSFGKERLEQSGGKGSRKKTNNKWFETQDSISYWEDFLKPKICWKAVGKNLAFALVEAGIFLTAPASFISAGKFNDIILAFLCSSVGKYYIYKNSDTTGAGDIMLNIQSLVKFPIPEPTNKMNELKALINEKNESAIDQAIYNLYAFNKEEIHYIESIDLA